MQELRSTEILDKEIQADARKKAGSILQKADLDCAKLLESLDDDIEKTRAEKELAYSKKLAAFEQDQKAAIPLQKECFEVSFIQNSIVKNINEYLASLSEEKRLEIALNGFDFTTLNQDKKITAYVYGFDFETAKKMLTKKLGKNLAECKETIFRKIALEDDCGLEKPQGIILEAQDKSFRCRLTLSQAISQILDKNRADLSDALFGGQL